MSLSNSFTHLMNGIPITNSPSPLFETNVVVVSENSLVETQTPKMIFIVPYRDREQQKEFFDGHMKRTIMADFELGKDYDIWYIHQKDSRAFNRGALKNIGFIIAKQKYPQTYRDITLIFNDIDTTPFTKNFLNYDTVKNVVKHFYGYTFALGGIVSIKACDFEQVNGFPNFWAWGFEDNLLNTRVLQSRMTIDRSQFYPIMDKNIMQQKDGLFRSVNKKEFDRYLEKSTEGISSIYSVQYTHNVETGLIDVTYFNTGTEEDKTFTRNHDLREGSQPFKSVLPQKQRTNSISQFSMNKQNNISVPPNSIGERPQPFRKMKFLM